MNTTVANLRASVNRRLVEYEASRALCRSEQREIDSLTTLQNDAREALAFTQGVASSVQAAAHAKIADIVSRSLEAVFDEPYAFKIRFEQKRGRTEAVLLFERDGHEIDPLTASGGGVVDVASFALRLSCLLLSRPPVRRVLIMDEPFRFVAVRHRDRVRALVEALAREVDCQFIIVTHSAELVTGKVVQL